MIQKALQEKASFDTNTYTITASSIDGEIDPFYIYELSHEGTGTGQWFIDIYQGVGGITVTNQNTGESTVLDGVAD